MAHRAVNKTSSPALSSSAAPDHRWVTVAEAAALTGQSDRTWRRKAAAIAWEEQQRGHGVQGVVRDISRVPAHCNAFEAIPPGGTKPTWYVARSFDAALSLTPSVDIRAARHREALLNRYPADYVEHAYKRLKWLRAWEDACKLGSRGMTVYQIGEQIAAKAKKIEGAGFKISASSLKGWKRSYYSLAPDGHVMGIRGLVDDYKVAPPPHTNFGDGDGGGGDDGFDRGVAGARSPEAVEFFYKLYRTQQRSTIAQCHRLTLDEARKHGWKWPRHDASTRGWLKRYDDRSTTFLLREGRDKWNRRYMPFTEIDYTSVAPGKFWQCDHTECDFWVRHDGQVIRPWLTVVQDLRSRTIVGWKLVASPHQDAILSALFMAFAERGVPDRMRIDNGKDYTSKLLVGHTKDELRRYRREARQAGISGHALRRRRLAMVPCDDLRWQGVMGELQIETIFAIPYSPWSKGVTERFFGTFQSQFSRTMPTYTGNAPHRRPESLAEILDGRMAGDGALALRDESIVPTLESARDQVGHWMTIHHATSHQGKGMNGLSPDQVWITAEGLSFVAPDELTFMAAVRGIVKVTANGVRVRVGGEDCGYGADSNLLRPYIGRDVVVAMHADSIGECFAFEMHGQDKKGRLIARLKKNELVPAGTTHDEYRRVQTSIRQTRRKAEQGKRAAARRTISAAMLIAERRGQQAAELAATGTDARKAELATVTITSTRFAGMTLPPSSDDVGALTAIDRLGAAPLRRPTEKSLDNELDRFDRPLGIRPASEDEDGEEE